MMRDTRTYIRVHDGIPDHPKVIGLSDKAFRAVISLWCYSSRHLTDGRVPAAVAASYGARVLAELAAVGLLEQDDGGWVCHDYLEHQQSKAERTELRVKRSEAGKRGGLAKANAVALAKQTPSKLGSKNVPELERELEGDNYSLLRGRANDDTQARTEFWHAMLSACRIAPTEVTESSRREYQKAARELTKCGATTADMMQRARKMRAHYSDGIVVTPKILAAHWGEFAGANTERPVGVHVDGPIRKLDLPEMKEPA